MMKLCNYMKIVNMLHFEFQIYDLKIRTDLFNQHLFFNLDISSTKHNISNSGKF